MDRHAGPGRADLLIAATSIGYNILLLINVPSPGHWPQSSRSFRAPPRGLANGTAKHGDDGQFLVRGVPSIRNMLGQKLLP